MDTCVFSKHLQAYGFRELGRALRAIGVAGVDLTVRPKGHVEPEEVADRLPEAAEGLRAEGVRILMITTAITSVGDSHARAVLETAAKLGIRFYKCGYYLYDGFGTVRRALAEARAKLKDLGAMSKEIGVFGGYHNHAGDYLGACPAHLADLVEDADPDGIGLFFDPAHATAEGACSGWKEGLDYVAPRVRMLALKDFRLVFSPEETKFQTVPMGEGIVRWSEFFKAVHRIAGQIGPVSIHAEYDVPAGEVLRLAARDKAFYERTWKESAQPR